MNLFHIGDSHEYIAAQYAKSGRSTCRGCKDVINKQELRIGLLLDDDHFGGTYWYHLNCFKFKPRHRVLDVNELQQKIYGMENLSPGDDDRVLKYLKEELTSLKQGKTGKNKKSVLKKQAEPQEVKKPAKDSKKDVKPSKSRGQTVSVDAKVSKSKGKVTKTESIGKVVQAKSVHTRQLRARKKSLPKDQKQKSVPKLKSKPKKSQKSQPRPQPKPQSKSQPKAAKKVKAPKQKAFLTASQVNQYKDLLKDYQALSNNQLKDILQQNGQPRTGTKIDLAQRCADGKQFGRIPTCSSCGGGKLRFNRVKGTYACPGYMQDTDFVHCGVRFNFDEVKRLDWQQS